MVGLTRNTKLYLVKYVGGVANTLHRLELYPGFSFSQTLNENPVRKRTLHNMNLVIDGATITSANPGNFSFTSPLINQSTYPILFDLATSINTRSSIDYFDLYFETEVQIYKLSRCIIQSLVFNLSMDAPITFSIEGSFSKKEPVLSLPLSITPSPPYVPTRVFGVSMSLGGVTLEGILNLNIEFVNNVEWKEYKTVHGTGIQYPSTHVFQGKRVSGSITELITSSNKDLLDIQGLTEALVLDIVSSSGESPPILSFNLPNTVYTRRVDVTGDFITRVYDFRLNSNTSNVKPIYKGVSS